MTRSQVPLADHRRNCDHALVRGPNPAGRYRDWQPVCAMYSIRSTTGSRSNGSSSLHRLSVASLGYDTLLRSERRIWA